MKHAFFAIGLLIVAGCASSAEPSGTTADSSAVTSASSSSSTATSVADLRALVQKQAVVFDDVTGTSSAKVLDKQASTELGVTDVDSLVRVAAGAVFNVLSVDGPTGGEGSSAGGSFGDVRNFLVLDAAGLAHAVKHGKTSAVKGDRLAQLKEVFARTPHPDAPNEPKWGDNPFFAWPNGEAVAFIGVLFVRTNDGAITRFALSNDSDSLDQ